MESKSRYRRCVLWFTVVLAVILLSLPSLAQSCLNATDLDVPTRTAIEGAARQYFDMAARGDVAGLKANAIPAIAGDFGSIEQAVVTNKPYLSGAEPKTVSAYESTLRRRKVPWPAGTFIVAFTTRRSG